MPDENDIIIDDREEIPEVREPEPVVEEPVVLPEEKPKRNIAVNSLFYLTIFFIFVMIIIVAAVLTRGYVISDKHYNAMEIDNEMVLTEVVNHNLKTAEIPGFSAILEDGRTFFAVNKIYLAFDPENSELEKEINEKMSVMQNAILTVLGSKSYFDVNTTESRENVLKPEIQNSINRYLTSGRIEDVYFGESINFSNLEQNQ